MNKTIYHKTIYQFYEGTMSDQTKAEVTDLKNKAEAAGWKYELYDLDRLLNEISEETLHWDHKNRVSNLKESLARMKKYLPIAKFGSACSDFFRFWCLQNGGLYCDDDVICTTERFPEFSEFKNGVWTCSEQTSIHLLNSCITWCDGEKGAQYSRIMTYLAATRLNQAWLGSFDDCKLTADYLVYNKWGLVSFLGPGFIRSQLLNLYNEGIDVKRFPYYFSSSHDPKSILFHVGDGKWIGEHGNPDAQRKNLKLV